MPGWNARETFRNMTDMLLECSIGLDELLQNAVRTESKGQSLGLDEALHAVTSELSFWGLDSLIRFRAHYQVAFICHEIMCELKGVSLEIRPGMRIDDVYTQIFPEYENLLKILSHREDGDLVRAKHFCLAATNRALASAMDASRRW